MRGFITLFSIVLLAVGTSQLNAASCLLGQKATQADRCNTGETGTCDRTAVFDAQAIVFSEQMRVNTDGNIRSYSATDPSGELCGSLPSGELCGSLPSGGDAYISGCAMNTVCNGIHISYANGAILRGTGEKSADVDVNCLKLVQEFERIRDNNWTPADLSRVRWGSVIRTKAETGPDSIRPCIVDNFLVSMASAKSGLPRTHRCDQSYYLDADVPSIVAPVCWAKSYRNRHPEKCEDSLLNKNFPDVAPGDLTVIRLRKAPESLIYAIVGDAGPAEKLGEASVGLHWRLKGSSGLPRTKFDSYALDNSDLFDVVIFPGSRPQNVVVTPDNFNEMENLSKAAFEAWGNGSRTVALEQLGACSLEASKK